MKKLLRYLLILIGIIVILAGGFAAYVAIRGVPKYSAQKIDLKVEPTPQRIEKGKKLASMLCNNCHLDRNTQKLSGNKMDETVYADNITQHPVKGIGKWTDGQLAYLLRTGIRPDGSFVPIMAKLSQASDEDIYSIISFLRSDDPWVQAVDTVQPDSKYPFIIKFICNIGAMKPAAYPTQPIPEPDTTNKIEWGKYIALWQMECYSCHSRDFAKNDYIRPERSKGFFGGGNEMTDMEGKPVHTLNITMDEQTGIGKWSEDDFVKALKYGQVPGNQPALRPPMQPYTNLTDNEARAIFAYLKTVPKLNNKVERKF